MNGELESETSSGLAVLSVVNTVMTNRERATEAFRGVAGDGLGRAFQCSKGLKDVGRLRGLFVGSGVELRFQVAVGDFHPM